MVTIVVCPPLFCEVALASSQPASVTAFCRSVCVKSPRSLPDTVGVLPLAMASLAALSGSSGGGSIRAEETRGAADDDNDNDAAALAGLALPCPWQEQPLQPAIRAALASSSKRNACEGVRFMMGNKWNVSFWFLMALRHPAGGNASPYFQFPLPHPGSGAPAP